jgi:hypothetical protein
MTERIAPSSLSAIMPPYMRRELARAEAANADHPQVGADHIVTSCADDGGPGTLRSIVEDSVNTASGDSINLTMLPMSCSRITLGTGLISGAIEVTQDTLHIHGPGAGALTIDGNGAQSIFFHFGTGTLGISGVTISHGYYEGAYPEGGCIYSASNVLLIESVVANCNVRSSSEADALGGAISTSGYLTLFDSVVRDSHAFSSADDGRARGGGLYSLGQMTLVNSAITDNSVDALSSNALAGAAYARSGAYIAGSTISRNRAAVVGGLHFASLGTVKIINSTISENSAPIGIGGIWATIPMLIANSTVSFNVSGNPTQVAGVYAGGPLTMQSTIVADNMGPNGQDDLDGVAGTSVVGTNNLVTSWDLARVDMPSDTRTSCPKLDPLADNGGSTLTHKLRHDSPAIDQGTPNSLLLDQRGEARVYPDNGNSDIGAIEWRPSDQDERIFANGFESVCDW